MKYAIREKIPPSKQYTWYLLKRRIFGFGNKTYAQFGEDLILKHLFGCRTKGFYVDVGAHHPKLISNTYYFYKLGWQGINIDATPGSMKVFKRSRYRDINLEIGVAEAHGELTFYGCNIPSLNTFSKEQRKKWDRDARIVSTYEVRVATAPLSYILESHLPQGMQIDFLSIDVEGMDFAVLQSNNWEKYRPRVILIEKETEGDVQSFPILEFLRAHNYKLYASTPGNWIFVDNTKRSE